MNCLPKMKKGREKLPVYLSPKGEFAGLIEEWVDLDERTVRVLAKGSCKAHAIGL